MPMPISVQTSFRLLSGAFGTGVVSNRYISDPRLLRPHKLSNQTNSTNHITLEVLIHQRSCRSDRCGFIRKDQR